MATNVLERNLREVDRLAALHEYGLLDTPADDELSAVVRVAAVVAEVPTATLNLIDENRQCQFTTVGFVGCDSNRSDSMCAIRFRSGEFVHVPDASADPTYRDNPWVTGQLADVRFYGSAPLITPDGYALGTLCVFDNRVKTLRPEQVSRLLDLADIIVALFERRRQSREHERKERFIETVLETIDVGVVVCDPSGHVTRFNRAAREWHGLGADPGLHPGELPDRYDLFHSDGVRRLAPDEIPLLRALRSGDVDAAEMKIKRPGRPDIDVSCTGRRLVADDGTLLGAVVAMNDVTSDRAYRRELELAHRSLAERGEQLTAAVAELRRSNEELEQFAGAVSHDLVRPMSAAQGFLELLTTGYGEALDQRGAKWLDSATRAVERMQNLVQALLTYARAGQAPFQPRPVPLAEVLAEVRADLRTIAEQSGAEITTPDDLPTVEGDPTLLRQLLQNLIDNAMKYRSPDRPCRIAVTAAREPSQPDSPGAADLACPGAARPAGRWVIRVADNGIGIPPEHRGRVFEMFAQVDPAARKGHGIGLSTCQRILERHHGAIAITDTPGGGTTILVSLPA